MTQPVDSAETRALVLAETLKAVSLIAGKFHLPPVIETVMTATGLSEEACAPDCMAAVGILVHHALLDCNTHDAERDEVRFTAETWFRVSPILTRYVWNDSWGDNRENASDGGDAA